MGDPQQARRLPRGRPLFPGGFLVHTAELGAIGVVARPAPLPVVRAVPEPALSRPAGRQGVLNNT